MSEVKRFRADHRHVVETEFDDAQFVSVSDYDATLAREAALREELDALEEEFDALEHTNITLKLSLAVAEQRSDEFEGLLHMSKELLTTISRHGVTTKPNDWCDSFKAEVAGSIEKIGAALKPAEKSEHICDGCGSNGWTGSCDKCIPY